MNLEQLLFTWKGRQLLLALFASNNKKLQGSALLSKKRFQNKK